MHSHSPLLIISYSILIPFVLTSIILHIPKTTVSPTTVGFYSPPAVIPVKHFHTATIIFLHGLNGTGDEAKKNLQKLRQPYMKVICPTANVLPITWIFYANMTAWFDLKDANFHTENENEERIENATSYVHQLIDDEVKQGIAPDRIIVAGFSQGGAIAMNAALTYPERLGGVVSMSGWLPMKDTIFERMPSTINNIPILQCHGQEDEIVPIHLIKSIASKLEKISKKVYLKTYAGIGHSLSANEMDDVKDFFRAHVPDDYVPQI